MDFDFRPRRRAARADLTELATVPVAAGLGNAAMQEDDAQNNTRSDALLAGQRYSNIKFGDGDNDNGNVVIGGKKPARPSSYQEFLETNDLELEPPAGSAGHNTHGSSKHDGSSKTPWFKRPLIWIKAHRRASLAIGAVLLLLIAGGTTYALTRPAKPVKTATVKQSAKPAAAPPPPPTSPLTGVVVSADAAKRPVTGVMIENTTFARPQSGLKTAGVVYEAIAEAGITRFLALYQEDRPGNIGPVRSSRPYYVNWAHSYNATYAHVGGSPDALAMLSADSSIRNLDQFSNSGYFHRITARDAPHNVYTNMDALDQANQSKGWTSSDFTAWTRKADTKPKDAAVITARTIDVSISGPTYNAHYDYVPEDNAYHRSEGGEAHMDADSNTQLEPKVVVTLVIPYHLESDGYHSHYDLAGTGAMTVFQDGAATKGTWQRATDSSPYTFTDANGHPLKLDAGQTWVTAIAADADVTYAP